MCDLDDILYIKLSMRHCQENWSQTPAWFLNLLTPHQLGSRWSSRCSSLYQISQIGNHLQLTSFWLLLQLKPVLAFDPLPYYLPPNLASISVIFNLYQEWFLSCTLETSGGRGSLDIQISRPYPRPTEVDLWG